MDGDGLAVHACVPSSLVATRVSSDRCYVMINRRPVLIPGLTKFLRERCPFTNDGSKYPWQVLLSSMPSSLTHFFLLAVAVLTAAEFKATRTSRATLLDLDLTTVPSLLRNRMAIDVETPTATVDINVEKDKSQVLLVETVMARLESILAGILQEVGAK